MAEPKWKVNARKMADCANAIRSDLKLRERFNAATGYALSFDDFAGVIAGYHLLSDLPTDKEVKSTNARMLEAISAFRKSIEEFQERSGFSFPDLFNAQGLVEWRAWRHRGHEWSPPQTPFGLTGGMGIEGYLDFIESQFIDSEINPERFRFLAISTPDGRLINLGKSGDDPSQSGRKRCGSNAERSRVIRFVVYHLKRLGVPDANCFELARGLIRRLVGETAARQIGPKDVASRVREYQETLDEFNRE